MLSNAEVRLLLTAQDQISGKLDQVAASLGRLSTATKASSVSANQMAGAFAVGGTAALLLHQAINTVAGGITNAAGGLLALSSRLEQARIGFTTMLGSVEKADEFIGQLQQKAESTAFDFPGLQQVAQSFLAMGISAENVLPIIDDVSNALSAAGHGGDTDRLQRVGQSLSEIAAQGKITAEQLRELSRNGIAVLPLLAEAFGKTTAEIRSMAENGQISANEFFAAFHSEVAMHYGDIQAQQAKTWAVAASNVGDIIGRLATTTFKELTEAATAGALALNEFLHSDRVIAWAADFKQAIHEVLTALAPLGAALRGLMGLGSEPSPAPFKAPPSTFGLANWQDTAIPPAAIGSADEYKQKIAQATEKVHGLTAELTGVKAEQDAINQSIDAVKSRYAAQLLGLRDQQEALNDEIAATKTRYEEILDPLNRAQAELQRLGEDTKRHFATILDPLKTQLDGITRKIEDTKVGYEAVVRPIEAQVTAIEKANTALAKQKNLVTEIADLNLRQARLNAIGDPNKRAEIAGKLEANQFSREELERKKELLELDNRKGRNDDKIEAVQKRLDALKRQQLQLDQQAFNLQDHRALVAIARQTVLNDAKKEQTAIDLARAGIATDQKTAPLKAQLDAAQAALKSALDPLEAQQRSIAQTIQDVSAQETAALKPIIDAQEATARRIQDTSRELADVLKPLEDKQKEMADLIQSVQRAEQDELIPLQAKSDALARHTDSLELEKRQLGDLISQWKDAGKEIKEAADSAEKIPQVLNLGGGTPPAPGAAPLQGPPVPHALIPAETIDNINAFAESLANLNGQLKAFNDAGHMTKLSNAALLLGVVLAGARIAAMLAGIGLGIAGIITFVGQLAAGFRILGAAAVALGGLTGLGLILIGIVLKINDIKNDWDALVEAWNKPGAHAGLDAMSKAIVDFLNTKAKDIKDWWDGLGPAVDDALGKAKIAFDTQTAAWKRDWDAWDVERTAAWNAFWDGLGASKDAFWASIKADWDRDMATLGRLWKTFWEVTLPGVYNGFWDGLEGIAASGWNALTSWLSSAIPNLIHLFDPLLALFGRLQQGFASLTGLGGGTSGGTTVPSFQSVGGTPSGGQLAYTGTKFGQYDMENYLVSKGYTPGTSAFNQLWDQYFAGQAAGYAPPPDMTVTGRKMGGPVEPDQAYLLHKDELLIPRYSGSVLTADVTRDLLSGAGRQRVLSGRSSNSVIIQGPLVDARGMVVHNDVDKDRLLNDLSERMQEELGQVLGSGQRFPYGVSRTP